MNDTSKKDSTSEDLKILLRNIHDHLSSGDSKFSEEQRVKLLRIIRVFDDLFSDENLKTISITIRTFEVLRSIGVAGGFVTTVFKALAIIIAGYVAVKTGAIEALKSALSNH